MVDFIQKKELNMAARAVRTINSLEPQAAAMRQEDFLQKTKEFSERLKSGETKEDILPEAYALCREAAKRTLGKRPYDVQMMGSVVLNFAVIDEVDSVLIQWWLCTERFKVCKIFPPSPDINILPARQEENGDYIASRSCRVKVIGSELSLLRSSSTI